MTGQVTAHARTSELVSKHVLPLFFINFESSSKLDIYPYLFNHHYIFQQPQDTRPLLPVSKNDRVEIILTDQSDATRVAGTDRTFSTGHQILWLLLLPDMGDPPSRAQECMKDV